MVKNLPASVAVEKQMATHSCIPAWKTPWTEEPGRLQAMGLPRVRHKLERLSMHSSVGDAGSIPRSGRSPGKGNGNPSSILAWEMPGTVHGVAKGSDTI